jgi:hypothetical protein
VVNPDSSIRTPPFCFFPTARGRSRTGFHPHQAVAQMLLQFPGGRMVPPLKYRGSGLVFSMTYPRGSPPPPAVPLDFARGQGFPPWVSHEKTAPSHQAFQRGHHQPTATGSRTHSLFSPYQGRSALACNLQKNNVFHGSARLLFGRNRFEAVIICGKGGEGDGERKSSEGHHGTDRRIR